MAIDRDKLLQNAAKLVEKKKYDKAIIEYQKIVQSDPRDARTMLKIGDLFSRMNNFAAAVETYDRVATFYAAQGFQLKAIAVFKQIREMIRKQAPELAGRYSHITPRLADIYAELNLVTDALAAYDEVATSYQKAGRDLDAITVFEKTVALDPKNPLPHLRLAEARCRIKDLDKAIDSFWTAAELLLGMRRPDDALKVIERIMHFRPEPIYARAAAELYLKKGDPQSGMMALSRLQVAFQANPKDLDTLALLAQAFEVIQQPDKALEVHLEMARLARDQKRGELWGQIMAHLKQVAPHNEQVRALEHAGPPPASHAAPPPAPPAASEVDVEVTTDEEAVDLDEDVEYLEEPDEAFESVGALPAAPLAPKSEIPPSRPPSVSSPSLRGELMDADDGGVDLHDAHHGVEEERGAPQSFQPSSHAHKAINDATQFQNMGLLDKAVEVLHIALEMDPNSIPIREKLREILVQAGEREPAILETLNIAIIHIHNQNPDEAEPLALEVLEIEPEHPDALNILDHVAALREAQGEASDEGSLNSYDLEGVRPSQAINQVPPAPAVPAFETNEYGPQDDAFELDADEITDAEYAADFEDEDFAEEPPVQVTSRTGLSTNAPAAAPSEAAAPLSSGGPRPSAEAIEEVLEEAEFFAAQGLYSDAIAILREMLSSAPHHVLLEERLREMESLEAGGASEDDAPDSLRPEDNAFDIAASLDALDELDEPATRPEMHSVDQEVDVDQVFAKFKEGVKAVVDDSDAATHYDLGLAYKEMGLLQDAASEFELASKDPARACMCFFMMGSIYKQMGDVAQATGAFAQGLAVEQKTNDEANGIEYELALLLQSEGVHREYVAHLKSIARRDPNYRDVAARIRALGETMPESGSDDDDFDAAFDNLFG